MRMGMQPARTLVQSPSLSPWPSGKPGLVVFPCAPMTTGRSPRRSIRSGETLGGREMGYIASVKLTIVGRSSRLWFSRRPLANPLAAGAGGRRPLVGELNREPRWARRQNRADAFSGEARAHSSPPDACSWRGAVKRCDAPNQGARLAIWPLASPMDGVHVRGHRLGYASGLNAS